MCKIVQVKGPVQKLSPSMLCKGLNPADLSPLYTDQCYVRKKLKNKKQHLEWIYCEPERLSSSKSCAKYEKWRDYRRQRRRWGRRWHFWLSPGPQHRFLGTTDTIKSRLKKATKQGQQCTLRFKMHFYQKGKPDSRFFCSPLGYLFWNTISWVGGL